MEDITTKTSLDHLTTHLKESPEYYNAWINVIVDSFIEAYNQAGDNPDIGIVAKSGAKKFVDFLIKQYASE